MGTLAGRRIVLGVTGSIAAYKAAELVRLLRQEGAEVQVVMTSAGERFITPLTLQTLSGRAVRQQLFDSDQEIATSHIELARWADLIVLAPASADVIARLAAGVADDLLTTLILASEAPVALAPAMNQQMWSHAATKDNVQRLIGRGVVIWGPAEGIQACGESGPGRMLEPNELLALTVAQLGGGRLQGLEVVITAGPTQEPLDPVRFIGNRSSGKMGFALASAFVAMGGRVTLISGPVALETPRGVERIDVQTAQEMEQAVSKVVDGCDIFVGCAAVSDYRPAKSEAQKIKKGAESWQVEMVKNPDIVAGVAAGENAPFCVGFAAETERLEERADAKRQAKGLDMIAANYVAAGGVGMEADDNALMVLWNGQQYELPLMEKKRLAHALAALIADVYDEKKGRTKNT